MESVGFMPKSPYDQEVVYIKAIDIIVRFQQEEERTAARRRKKCERKSETKREEYGIEITVFVGVFYIEENEIFS